MPQTRCLLLEADNPQSFYVVNDLTQGLGKLKHALWTDHDDTLPTVALSGQGTYSRTATEANRMDIRHRKAAAK